MVYIKRIKKTIKEGINTMTTKSIYIETDKNDSYKLDYNNYCFDREGMEYMAREAERMLEEYYMKQELEELEEENYFALSERYRMYSTLDLIRKLFTHH